MSVNKKKVSTFLKNIKSNLNSTYVQTPYNSKCKVKTKISKFTIKK